MVAPALAMFGPGFGPGMGSFGPFSPWGCGPFGSWGGAQGFGPWGGPQGVGPYGYGWPGGYPYGGYDNFNAGNQGLDICISLPGIGSISMGQLASGISATSIG